MFEYWQPTRSLSPSMRCASWSNLPQWHLRLGDYRVVVIEDADRMSERTSNVLLKALEEPQDKTIWMLCAPSAADLLPTIRSRTRNVSLRLPSNQEVAQLLVQRDGVAEDLAIQSARQAQQHVGMARRLAVSQDARARRQETMRELASITNLSGAMAAQSTS